MKYFGHTKLLCELSKLSNEMLLTSSDTKQRLMHLFLFRISTQREPVQFVRRIYATAINFPCIIALGFTRIESYKDRNLWTKIHFVSI